MTNRTWLFCSVNFDVEQALFDWALEHCAQHSIELKVVVVLPKLSSNIFAWFEQEKHQDLTHEQTQLELKNRHEWQQKAKLMGVQYSIEIHFGKLFYEVVQLSHQYQVELIVKQAEDIEQAEGVFFQSDDWHLLRKSSLPLLLYRKNTPLPFNDVMVSMGVDMDIDPYQPSELNQNLLTWFSKMSKSSPLKIVHAWYADVENLMRHWSTDLDEDTLNQLSEKLYYQHKKALDIELKHSALYETKHKLFMCKGEPAAAIAKVVEEQNTDLLILGSLARGGIPGLLIGNTAEDLLERVNCSVLTVKPEDFQSPIL